MLKDKRILVTGGAGSIGSEIVRQLAPTNKLFLLDQNESGLFLLREELRHQGHWIYSRTGDIRDREVIRDLFEDFKPEVIFNAAALKHVTPAEEYPEEYVATNILGTMNLIREAKRWECLEKFVHISTDKVVNASCIMGITKLCAEGLVRRAGRQFVSVRFGNVMNSQGSVLEIWKRQKELGIPLTITDERMTRYMMTIPDAVALVIKAAIEGQNGQVFILDMGEPKNILDLKQELYGDYPHIFIGARPGEELSERLMTSDEEMTVERQGSFFVINTQT